MEQQATSSDAQNVPYVHAEHMSTLPYQNQVSRKVGGSKQTEKKKRTK